MLREASVCFLKPNHQALTPPAPEKAGPVPHVWRGALPGAAGCERLQCCRGFTPASLVKHHAAAPSLPPPRLPVGWGGESGKKVELMG